MACYLIEKIRYIWQEIARYQTFKREIETQQNTTIRMVMQRLQIYGRSHVEPQVLKIESYHRLLYSMPGRRWLEWSYAIIVAVICTLVLGVAWNCHYGKNKIILTAQGKAITLKIGEKFIWNQNLPITPRPLLVEQMTWIEFPASEFLYHRLQDAAQVEVDGEYAWLNQLNIEKGGILTIESREHGQVDLYGHGALFGGKCSLRGDIRLWSGQKNVQRIKDRKISFRLPETITFESKDSIAVPAHLQFQLKKEDFVMRNLHVDGLSLSHEEQIHPGAPAFVATVTKGRLELSDVAETIVLHDGDQLSLENVSGRVVEVRVREQVNIRVEGHVGAIYLGPKGFERNLAPTFLRYAYHKQRLPLFVTAFSLLWGLLWSTRKMLLA